MFTCIMIVITFKMVLYSRYFNYLNFLALLPLSFFLYYAYLWVSNYFSGFYTENIAVALHESAVFYLTVFFIVGFCYIIDLLIESIFFNFYTNPSDFLRKIISTK
mmetsp:Transcript_17366/g.12362  ORF Transcript_17366/g.12362 Transcript_17366/m.12362 type:complete len:105 (+) Transcript_17366:1560-1874(+)